MVPKLGDARRSQVVTVRLDPRLKYLAELAARKQRRTLSSYIEWAVEQSLSQVTLRDAEEFESSSTSVSDAEKRYQLYDVDEVDRLTRLGLNFPELLTHDEQVLWKLIRDCGALWKGRFEGADRKWTWDCKESSLLREELHKTWDTFVKVARGEAPESELPTWIKNKESAGGWDTPSKRKTGDLDDDIPF